jgi:hypothetical protein
MTARLRRAAWSPRTPTDPSALTTTRCSPLPDVADGLVSGARACGLDGWGRSFASSCRVAGLVAGYPVSQPTAVEPGSDRCAVTNYDTNGVLGFAR